MRKSSQINKKKFTPLLFCSVLVLQQAMLNAADASTITDGNGVAIEKHPITGNYEISPDFFNGKVGFKKYQDMNLSKGDIMNFIFEAYKLEGDINNSNSYWDSINTFINLVQNQINLNGVVNAVVEGGGQIKPDSNLVFVSPNGMIVGASGVLNVGSLNVYTPTQSQFDVLYNGIGTAQRDPDYGTPYAEETTMTWDSASIANGNAPITINGKVIARGDIGLAANTVTVAKATGGTTGGFLLAGINTSDLTALTDEAAANTLFNSLVNVDNMNTGSGFANSNGKIVITSGKGVSVDADSAVKNYANNGIVSITNGGSDGISLAGEVSNGNGTLAITNVDGALTQASTGVLKNKGTMTVTNTASGTGLTLDGTVINDGTMTITNESGADGLYIGGSVTNNTGSATIHNQVNKLEIKSGATVTSNGTSMEISNCGVNGLKVAGSVYNNTGAGTIANADTSTVGGLEITGFVQNDGSSLNVINSGAGGLIVANGGKVLNNSGTAILSNTVNKLSINAGGVAENKGDALYISNSGDNGLSIAGNVLNNSGILGVQNTEDSDGGIDISGLVQNDGSQMQISNFGFGDLNVTGKVLNNTGYARIENNHAGLNVASSGVIENNADQDASVALEITNNGEYDLSIAGKVLNKAGSAVITNNGDTLDISGLVQNDGSSMTITNNGLGGLNVSGTVDNTNGNLHMNSTEFNFEVTSDGVITNSGDNATLTNTGEEGFNIKGKVHNQTGAGDLLISQDAFGDLRVSGEVINDGTSLEMVNGSDSENFDISGSVTNNNGTATLTNNGVYFDVSGAVTTDNNSTSLVMSNAGTGHFTISGTVDNNAGTADLINEGTTFTVTNTGKIINDGTSLYMGNTGTGDFNIDGTVTNNKNEVSIVNGGTNTKLAINGTVTNSGSSLEIANSGKNGIIIAGNVQNSRGTASITNEVTSTVGGIDISGTVKNDGTSLDITNYGAGGLNVSGLVNNTSGDLTMLNDDGGFNVTADGSIYNVGSDALLENSGSDGFNINGTVHNQTGAGTIDIMNGSGKLIVGADGEVINDGTALKMTNKSGASDFEINGNVTNNKGTATLVNNGVTFKVTTTGNVVNGGTSLTMSNSGTGGFIIDGLVDNNSGNLTMQNEAGEFNITSTGVVTNSGEDANLSHTGTRTDFVIDGKVHNETNAGDMNILNESVYGKLTVGSTGEVINDGTSLNMTNAEGAGNFEIAGNVTNNNGSATLLNQGSTFDVSGTVTSKGTKLTMTNSVDDDFIISGKVINNKGTAEIINDAEIFHITADGRVENFGDKLIITNNGEGGLLIEGDIISQVGVTKVINSADKLTLSGASIQSYGTSLEVTNSGANGMNIAGFIVNGKGTATVNNTTGSMNINGGSISNDGGSRLDVLNSGNGGLNVLETGWISSTSGELIVNNTKGGLNIKANSAIENEGDSLSISNSGADGLNLTDGGIIHNLNGVASISNTAGSLNLETYAFIVNAGSSLTVSNSGVGGLNVHNSTIENQEGIALIQNTNDGLNIAEGGLIQNWGDSLVINNNGNNGIDIAGSVFNGNGTTEIENTNGGLNVLETGIVNNSGVSLTMTNSGSNGFVVDGKIINTNGSLKVINTNNKLEITKTGVVENSGTSLEVTNSGVNGMSVAGNILNTKGTAIVTNTAGSTTGGLNISGVIQNSGTSLDVINNGAGGLNLQTGDNITAGGSIVNYNGDLTVTNTAGGLNIQADSDSYGSISNAGDNMTITNSGAGGLNVKGEIAHNGADAVIKNTNGALNITGTTSREWASPDNVLIGPTGRVVSYGESLTIENSGAGGLNISGEMSGYNPAKGSIVSNAGTLNVKNTNGALNVTSTGEIISKGTSVTVENSGAGGMNIQGIVKHDNTAGQVEFINLNSDMTVGHDSNEYNIDSNADVNIKVTNGNLLNYGVNNILIRTTNGADLVTTVTDGSVGLEVGPCDGGVCTGVGPAERDLTKSINTNIDGTITIDNTGDGALVNLASIDKDMHVNRIYSDGRVILLADDKDKGASPYSILNKSDDNLATPNLKGSGISAIASGNIGESKTDRITFVQTGVDVEIANEHDDATQDHELYTTPLINNKAVGTEYVEGVEFLAIGDINIKGLDDENGNKVDTKVCTISSREGTVNAEFSGDTYIRDITAQNEVNVVTRGTEMYIENLGGAPSRYATTGDYYGDYTGIVPEKATVQALDMGTEYAPNEEPNSTVVIKNGTINGKGSTSHPNLDQDVTVTADNAYVGGYYFNMGKHRMPGLSSVTPDDTTNPLVNGGDPDTPVSIRGKAVRPDDVTATGEPEDVREYYYGYDPDNGETPDDAGPDGDVPGSGQRDDETFDPDKEKADDLVVPEPEPQEPPAGDDDDDQPDPPPAGDDDDDQPDPPPAGDDDDDQPAPPPAGDDDDDQPDPPPAGDDDDDQPDPPPAGDDDDDQPDPPPAGDDDDDDQPVTPPPADDDKPEPPVLDEPEEEQPKVDQAIKQTWKKEYTDYIEVIDKRQYMRFDTEYNQNPVAFNSESQASGILNISRGGVQLSHDKSLKVGDVVPVHIKYGDVEINTDVKVVSTTDKTAGAEFVDLDLATKNKILYLSLLEEQGERPEGEFYADIKMKNDNLSTTSIDD